MKKITVKKRKRMWNERETLLLAVTKKNKTVERSLLAVQRLKREALTVNS